MKRNAHPPRRAFCLSPGGGDVILEGMAPTPPTDDELHALRRPAAGAPDGWRVVLARHRDRLRRLAAFRLDRRLWGRIDPSDVVQEALLDASRRLAEYVAN